MRNIMEASKRGESSQGQQRRWKIRVAGPVLGQIWMTTFLELQLVTRSKLCLTNPQLYLIAWLPNIQGVVRLLVCTLPFKSNSVWKHELFYYQPSRSSSQALSWLRIWVLCIAVHSLLWLPPAWSRVYLSQQWAGSGIRGFNYPTTD